jgi:hypothetical protein
MPTVVEKIRLVNTDEVDSGLLAAGLERMEAALGRGTDVEVREAIRVVVPEYRECVSRTPITDVEVQLGGAGRGAVDRRPPTRSLEAPVRAPLKRPIGTVGLGEHDPSVVLG